MTKYKLIYSVSEGDYAMEVFTGLYILAEDRDKAMNAARRLDEIVSSRCRFSVCFELHPFPHVDVKWEGIKVGFPEKRDKCCIMSFKICRPQGAHESIMGYPVFTKNDFETVSEAEFINNLQRAYENYFTQENRTYITFEPVSYGVEENKQRKIKPELVPVLSERDVSEQF